MTFVALILSYNAGIHFYQILRYSTCIFLWVIAKNEVEFVIKTTAFNDYILNIRQECVMLTAAEVKAFISMVALQNAYRYQIVSF